jgi:hypothetical protein
VSWSIAGRVLSLMLGVALPLAAQEGGDPLAKLDPNSRFQIELILDSARTLGIPTRPLLSKAYLGVSRGANPRQIVRVVRAQFAHSKEARIALGASLTEDEFSAAAAALQAGVPTATLSKFRSERAKGPLLRALVVLGDLITRGVPTDEASSTIVQLWQDGAGDADFQGLWKGVEQDILSGQPPGIALQQRAREFPGRASDRVTPSPSARPPEQLPDTPSS